MFFYWISVFLLDGNELISGDESGVINIYDCKSGKLRLSFQAGIVESQH